MKKTIEGSLYEEVTRGISRSTKIHDFTRYYTIIHDITRYYMILHDITQHDITRHDITRYYTIF